MPTKRHVHESGTFVDASFKLAWHYSEYDQGKDIDAEPNSADISNAGTDPVTGKICPMKAYHAKIGLARLAEKRDQSEVVLKYYRLTVEAAIGAWGGTNRTTLSVIDGLVRVIRGQGLDEVADEVLDLHPLIDEFSRLAVSPISSSVDPIKDTIPPSRASEVSLQTREVNAGLSHAHRIPINPFSWFTPPDLRKSWETIWPVQQ
jgi:hypothetical protein